MDTLFAVLVALVLLVVLAWLVSVVSRPSGLPPGPWGLPLVGYLPFLGPTPYITMARMSRKYGPVFTLPLGSRYAVVLNNWTAVKEALVLQGDTFSGRPSTVLTEDVYQKADISTSEGRPWKEKRRFTLRHLKDFGFGRHSMEAVIMLEIDKLIDRFKERHDQKVDICDAFFFSFMNVAWTIIGGKRFEMDDAYMVQFIEVIKALFDELTNNKLVNFMPLLKYVPGSGFHRFLRADSKLNKFLEDEVDEHVRTFQEGSARDFIDVFLEEIFRLQKAGIKSDSFTKRTLVGILHNLFTGAVDTGSNTISWGLLYVATWPEIQRKVQQEIDQAIGRARLPTWQDRLLLPYTEAVLLEIQRYVAIVPLSLPHCTMTSTNLFGYAIPKDTFILENIWAVHHDPRDWGDPEVFRPERFLNASGEIQRPENVIPFSVGGRTCLGEPLAKMELFLFFSCLMHQFTFSLVSGEKPPSFEPLVSLTLRPHKFSLRVTVR